MKPAQILILAIALSSAGTAAYLAMEMTGQNTIIQMPGEPVVRREATVNVLVVTLPP